MSFVYKTGIVPVCFYSIESDKSRKLIRNICIRIDHQFPTLLSVGKKITSLIAALSVSSIVSRSIPYPMPPVGGIPISMA